MGSDSDRVKRLPRGDDGDITLNSQEGSGLGGKYDPVVVNARTETQNLQALADLSFQVCTALRRGGQLSASQDCGDDLRFSAARSGVSDLLLEATVLIGLRRDEPTIFIPRVGIAGHVVPLPQTAAANREERNRGS